MPERLLPAARLLCFLPLLFTLALCGCGGSRQQTQPGAERPETEQATVMATGAKRADPGYIQYLERLSMLGNQTELARIVSGSQLAWLRPADTPYPDPLLALADTWLSISPLSLLPETKRTVFASLASPRYWQIFNRARVGGLYLSPVSGAGGLWAYNRKASLRGEDTIQYAFSEAAGSEQDYFNLLSAANTNRKLIGLELVPAATGLGPDFFLAARYHRQYAGTYCMVEIPAKLWGNLPNVSDQWHGVALSGAQVAELAGQNFLPRAMVQDFSPHGQKCGWAATTEIHGVDGLPRRWVYRYYGSPDRPVLNWEDPSADARKILSGSVIRSVGVLGGALVGMRLDGLHGLDAAVPGRENGISASPADQAAVAISREVRRYGGWSYLRDELPLTTIASLMQSGPDFFQDWIFSPGVEHAILTGSTNLLQTMTDEALALDLDMRRFVHGTVSGTGVSYDLAHLAAVASGDAGTPFLSPGQAENMRRGALAEAQNAIYATDLSSSKGNDVPPLHNRRLYTTPAGLGALALGAGNAKAVTREMEPDIRNIHLIQVFFRAMLPGLLMLSGQDIAGALPLSWHAMENSSQTWDVGMTSRGAYALTQSALASPVTAQGVAQVKSVYPTADVQQDMEDSFLTRISETLALRTALGIAHGKLLGRFATNTPGCFALAVLLPSSGPQRSGETAKKTVPHLEASGTADAEEGNILRETKGRTLEERRKRQREEEARKRAEMELRIVTVPQGNREAAYGETALITVFNFSREQITREVFNLHHDDALRRIRLLGDPMLLAQTGDKKNGVFMSYGPTTVTVTLPPWSGAAVLIGKRPQ